MNDVRLFVSTETTNSNTANPSLFTVNAFNGTQRGVVNNLGGTNVTQLEDIVIRSDGALFGYQSSEGGATGNGTDIYANNTANQAGNLVELSPGTGAALSTTSDAIRGPIVNATFTAPSPYGRDVTYSDNVDALTFDRTGQNSGVPTYNLYYSVRDLDGPATAPLKVSKLFIDSYVSGPNTNPDGAVSGFVGYIGGAEIATGIATISGTEFDVYAPHAGDAPNGRTLSITRIPAAVPTGVSNPTVSFGPTSISATVYTGTGTAPIAMTAQTLVNAINRVSNTTAPNPDGAGILIVSARDGNTNIGNAAASDFFITITGGSDPTQLTGYTTGMAVFTDNGTFGDDNLYGVSDDGEFYQIGKTTGDVTMTATVVG